MHALTATAAVLAVAAAPNDARSPPTFAEWVRAQGRVYATKEELVFRRSIFAANVAKIEAHNAGGHPWSMGSCRRSYGLFCAKC